MIICHCNVVTSQQIESVVETLLADDPWQQLTPGVIFHALGKQGQCCSCFPYVIKLTAAKVKNLQTQAVDQAQTSAPVG